MTPRSGDEQKLRAKVWNLRPLGILPVASNRTSSKPPDRLAIKSASVPELLAIGRQFAQRNGAVALHFLEAVQERANEDDDLSSPWYGLPRAVDDDLRRE